MKAKNVILSILMIVIIILMHATAVNASSVTNSMRLSFTVIASISLDIDEDYMSANLNRPEAEAFSELQDHNILVDKLVRNDKSLWRFTKTE